MNPEEYNKTASELYDKFDKDFMKNAFNDATFRQLFEGMIIGMTPYKAIEILFEQRQEIYKALSEMVIKQPPKPIIIHIDSVPIELKNLTNLKNPYHEPRNKKLSGKTTSDRTRII